MEQFKSPVRWLRSYWDEEDELFFFEADRDGWVLRQVVLRGPDRTPTVAAARAEVADGSREGLDAVRAYDAKYGGVAERPITEWDEGFPHVEIDRAEFDRAWAMARAHLGAKRP